MITRLTNVMVITNTTINVSSAMVCYCVCARLGAVLHQWGYKKAPKTVSSCLPQVQLIILNFTSRKGQREQALVAETANGSLQRRWFDAHKPHL